MYDVYFLLFSFFLLPHFLFAAFFLISFNLFIKTMLHVINQRNGAACVFRIWALPV